MRRDIAFQAEGCTLRGWLYLPAGATGPFPAVVMAHGFSAVKEQALDRYAEVFAGAGLAALVFDNRGFGASEGEPRQEVDPVRQIRDWRHAISFARTLPEVDAARIGIWGSSYSGGHVLVLGAVDRRVRCVVAQVPTISGWTTASRRTAPDRMATTLARFDADQEARFAGAAPAMIPVVAEKPNAPCVLPGAEAHAFFTAPGAPAWRNEVTLQSAAMSREYEPGIWVPRIGPTPLLLLVAEADTVTPADLALEAYNQALEPKQLVLLPGGHFDPYGAQFDASSGTARDWFVRHLRPRGQG
ncbi:alpha/beta hydrolase [Siccirubricoccus sp. G192]|uniref:alpha/beta hydrolase n=1 Tax=Siccirubricoccus sp. G192 TaxID=2849651 RepID=UPI001C2B993B|nr:alpha/beta hydrolase [Siccirubricoccus sp. G192]MBV1799258.1 alpha/beta hydrolase [Siccirubricoccus sp. G192]